MAPARGRSVPRHEARSKVKLVVHILNEAMDLFAPLAPCPECKRPLPVPFENNYEHWPGCWVGAREAARAAMSCCVCEGPCDGPCEEGDKQFEGERQGNLADAVGKFLSDIFWDEMGDGAVAIFDADKVNDLRNALERSCGKGSTSDGSM